MHRWHRSMGLVVWFSLVVLSQATSVSGQLVGNRTLGAPALSLQQQRSAATTTAAVPGVGTTSPGGAMGLQGSNNRFIRGNRARGDFVGSNRTDQRGFIGSGQAIGVGQVRSATDNLRIETGKSDRINRPLPPQPAKGMYYPRLEIDFAPSSTSDAPVKETTASTGVLDRVSQFSGGSVQVMMAGSTAILRGTVHSARESELLAQVLSFEPGVDRVRDETIVK